jgi:hypothetical protein
VQLRNIDATGYDAVNDNRLIKNFGHFWERKYIEWGHGGSRGHLEGYRTKTRWADFREQIGVYVLYDADLNPIYVGQAGSGKNNLFDRLRTHRSDHLWNRWTHFTWFGFRGVTKQNKLSDHDKISKQFKTTGNSLLNEHEGVMITALEPKLNKQGARWPGVEEFYQEIEDELEEPRLADIITEVKELGQEIRKRVPLGKRKKRI